MKQKRNVGARCDESGKINTIKFLNTIYGEITINATENANNYTKENTSNIKQPKLCILEELTLRYFEHLKLNKKTWFLTPEMVEFLRLK